MSKLTQSLLGSIDYRKCKAIRERSFRYFHNKFKRINELKIDIDSINGPMVYPLLISKKGIKDQLIKNKIYVATYWESVLDHVSNRSFESKLVKCLVPLPVDQRYDVQALSFVAERLGKIKKYS